MNANELADEVEHWSNIWDCNVINVRKYGKEVAAMLRQFDLAESIIKQQQIEITNMQERMIMSEQELNHMRSFFGCDPAYYGMTPAEPVAWMQIHYKDGRPTKFSKVQTWEDDIPLYTHPAKTQEPDCYGDGNVYRGVRSKDSEIQTIHIDSTAKTLTAQEIRQTAVECGAYINEDTGSLYPDDMCVGSFARAILRKAQEK
jgi:hypothetical protein